MNPGGVEAWKSGQRNLTGLDDALGGREVTPRAILETLADAANALRLPHPVHIHCNNLGVPGNAATTLATMQALAGRRAHFTHLQFHCYGGEPGSPGARRAAQIIDYVNAHPEVSADVGQVMFGPAMTVTADGPVEYLLHKSSGRKWTNIDIELETGCGIVPLIYKDKAAVSRPAVGHRAGAVPAERRPVAGGAVHRPPERRLVPRVSRAHPAADGPERPGRAAQAGESRSCWPAARWPTASAREYTLNEIAIITRAGPARLLGPRAARATWASAPTPTSRSTAATPTSRRCSRRRDT